MPPPLLTSSISPAALTRGYGALLRRPWTRVVLATVCAEAFLFYGAFTFVGAYLHDVFGLDYARVGLLLGCMGLGGLLYALTVRQFVRRLGERGLALGGGVAIAIAFPAVALGSLWLDRAGDRAAGPRPVHAAQHAPDQRHPDGARGARPRGLHLRQCAVHGQAAGVWLSGLLIDRIGFAPVFIGAGAALLAVGAAFSLLLRHRQAST